MSQVNYFFSPPFIGTNWFPRHSFVPTPVLPSFHDLTSAHKYVLPPIAEKFPMLFFSTIQTKHNSQSILLSGITRGVVMRLVMSCPALRQDIGPFEDLSILTKFALVQQVVRTCCWDCLTKCIARATRTNQKTTASLFLLSSFFFVFLFDKFQVSKNVFALVFCNK